MPSGLRVLIVGSGAREHCLSTAYEKSPLVETIIVTPGNDFMAFNRKKEVIVDKNSKLTDSTSILEVAQTHHVDLVDVAQDDALAAGTVDVLRAHGFKVFGPTQEAARLEWDKQWSREFMQRNGIPTPSYHAFSNPIEAKAHLAHAYAQNENGLYYIKATGLCAGKGALKTTSLPQAYQHVDEMAQFGEAGKTFLVEEGLQGEEYSTYAISDGNSYQILPSAQDHKTLNAFDEGPQTGGMGTYSPVQVVKGKEKEIEEKQINPVVKGMQVEGHPYCGIIYVGGMVTEKGINTIEYNSRWGDPECQVVVPGIKTDYADLILHCVEGKLNELKVETDGKTRVCVVGASRGYPGDYSEVKGKPIMGLEEAAACKGVQLFGAGMAWKEGKWVANGGRLLSVV